MTVKVGILALQGGISEHQEMLKKIKVTPSIIKKESDLKGIDGLIIPGGESTTIKKLMLKYNLIEPIKQLHRQGKPIWGTCAGLILLARDIEGNNYPPGLGFIDISVKRNAYGSQLNSFITSKVIPEVSPEPIEMVFIRAPLITSTGPDVKVLTTVNQNIVAAEERNILVTSFHPELTSNPAFHQYFIEKIIIN